MGSMNIDLPDSMRAFVRERVAEGGFGSVGEYVRDLIRADQERKAAERVDSLLMEGLDSGGPIPAIAEFWEERKRGLREWLEQTPNRP